MEDKVSGPPAATRTKINHSLQAYGLDDAGEEDNDRKNARAVSGCLDVKSLFFITQKAVDDC